MSCAPLEGTLAERVEDARVVFVGTVSSIANEEREATVAVESIWIGPRLPETVVVSGAPDGATAAGAQVASSVDRTFERGTRYLFVPNDAAPPFKDDACTATTEYTAAVARLEPEGTIAPQSGTDLPWIGLLMVLFAVAFWQTRRARRKAAEIDV